MGKMFKALDEALSETLDYVIGAKKNLRSKEFFIPNAPKNYDAAEIKNLRSKLEITQQELGAGNP